MPSEPTDHDYEVRRLAEVIAEITSGTKDAIPEQDDFDLARKELRFIEANIKRRK